MAADSDWWRYAPTVSPWPHPFDVWGTAYPTGRGTETPQATGWLCAGCGRGYAPMVRQCRFCGPQERPQSAAGVSRRLGPGDEISDEDAER